MGKSESRRSSLMVREGRANLVVSSSVLSFPQSYFTMGPMKTSSPEDKSILVSGLLWRVEVDICFWSATELRIALGETRSASKGLCYGLRETSKQNRFDNLLGCRGLGSRGSRKEEGSFHYRISCRTHLPCLLLGILSLCFGRVIP